MTQDDLRNQFHEETGIFYFKNHSESEYIEWLENKLIESNQSNTFHGYCKQENKGKSRCKDICGRPECGY